ncbi:hypothetical protein [Capnocytophaga catalasegens]|uniref:Uncharacterized protein n=1 Tax=Capnocytophaga catalasegens TaxID=1004260 RepID=A0AAV5B029_9FLAO|nr:hypothetical protein [Capnocytophaga catalasegens]GIZ15286.1 hypothetical protein RCZ03_12860 [Capnocytophaga catalasegens]GJM51220.1 hypothetical protein RCZ15_21930 [Capnocytophaga catalasegens]GJM53014.1 hypothetical protein RCZ16_13310 [Capnocytophaga catalasegens]
MKISLKLSKDVTKVLSIYFNRSKEAQPRTRRQRVQLSIMQEVAVKTQRFYIGFHDSKKKRKISFKIYEADMIEQFFSDFIDVVDEEYSKNVLRKIIAEINQQLA